MSKAQTYETICVFQPDVQGEKFKTLSDKIKKIFTNHKVEEVTQKDWGNRKLAYPIKNFKTANYVQYIYAGNGDLVKDLEKNLGYEESVLRFLTLKYDANVQKHVQLEPDGFDAANY